MTAIRTIPFFPYPQLFTSDEGALLEVMREVCSRGAYILQKECVELEKALATFLGVKHVFGVANGTDAILIGLKAAGIRAGDEVILPSHTYIATAAAVQWLGAIPVLADCGPDHMLDVTDIEHRITPKTRAIMPVQINGRTCDMAAIEAIAKKHHLIVCEDAAQALGSRFGDRCAGTFGAFGTFSFYPAKLLGCFGDGGAIATNDDAIATQIKLLRDHGRNDEGRVVAWGLNSRLDNLQAAVLLHKFKTYPADIERRRAIATRYQEQLSSMSQLQLPPAPNASANALHFDVYQNYELQADSRDALRQHLLDRGVRTIIQWAGTPVHAFKELGFTDSLPKTEKLFQCCLMLPMNTALADDDVDYICDCIKNFYESL